MEISESGRINYQEEEQERITFANFLSDYDPSFILLMTYCDVRKCSYLKILKIFNKVEQQEDWESDKNNNENEERSYSQVEDEAKQNLIQNLRLNL